ncbi:hypothetical protein [Mangrovicoccus sp. HB161399]|uniref:hypothetical protein n=1 Tax=Mangrovicoccus sp. HB161399 TaxID=2720392 RepID=UPI0015542647|nr:hypothetical protein [Mangrovicoccus sp. HB161399]
MVFPERMVRAALAAAGLASLLAAGTPAAAKTYCAELVEEKESAEGRILTVNFAALFDLFRRDDPSQPSRISDSKYWFTTRFGQFDGLTCGRFGHEMQEFYPIGMVVKPLRQLKLPNYHRGTPVLVETEYGHRKILPLEDITEMAENTTYILPDSAAKAFMCNHEDTCGGNLAPWTLADGRQIACPSANCRYDISALGGYASAASQNPKAQKALAEYARLYRDPLLPAVRYEDESSQRNAMKDVCTPFPVTPWKAGGTRHQDVAVYLSLCSEIAAGEDGVSSLAGFKVVDTAWAEERFGDGLWGSYHRRFGESTQDFDPEALSAEHVAETMRQILTVQLGSEKRCGQKIEETNSLTLGGAAGFDLGKVIPLDALKLSVDAARARATRFTATIPENVFLAYSTYFVQPIPLEGEEKKLWVFDIVSRVQCDGAGTPEKPSSITLFYYDLTDGYESLDADESFSERYLERYGNVAFASTRDAQIVRTGRFWRIVDHVGYYLWRDALREVVSNDMPQLKQLLQYYPRRQQPQIRDFFVHLLLAAAFDYDSDFPPNW